MKHFLYLIIILSSQMLFAQEEKQDAMDFIKSVFELKNTIKGNLDSLKIKQFEDDFEAFENPVQIEFNDSIIIVKNFSFLTLEYKKDAHNTFYLNNCSLFGKEAPFIVSSSMLLDKNWNDRYEFKLFFHADSKVNNEYLFFFGNTGFDIYFKGSLD